MRHLLNRLECLEGPRSSGDPTANAIRSRRAELLSSREREPDPFDLAAQELVGAIIAGIRQ